MLNRRLRRLVPADMPGFGEPIHMTAQPYKPHVFQMAHVAWRMRESTRV